MATWSAIPTDVRKTDVTGTLTFDERIINFNESDLQLRRDSDNLLYDLTRTNTDISNLGSNRYRITVTFADVSGFGQQSDTFYLRLKQRSVRYLRDLSYQPPQAVDSAGFSVDTFPPASVTLTFATTTGLVTGNTVTLNITINRDADLQIGYFSADVGTLTNLRGSGQSWQVDLELPAVGEAAGTATVTLAANSFFENPEATASVDYGAAPFIQSIEDQNILVDTEDYELTLNTISVQATHKVTAVGDWDNGFYHEFDESTGEIKVKNALVERLETQKNWRFLVEGGDAVLAERDVGYNVVPEAPVIGQVEPQTIYKGVNYNIFIPVTGIPAEARIRGNLIGAKSVATHEGGVSILGNLPADANIDFTEFEAPLYVANNAGSHQRNIPFVITEGTPTDVPGSLSNVSASAQGTSIRFSWNPPISDGGLEVLDYEVKIGDGQWIPKGLSARSHTFTGLTAGRSYTVYGRSRNADGYSAEVSRTVVIPGQVPNDISVLLIPSGAPSFSTNKRVSFGAATQATSYQIKYDSGQWITISRGRTHSTTGLLRGNETISVRAINQYGYGPERSYSYSGVAIPRNPTFTARNLSVANGQITVRWTLPSSGAGWGNQPVYVRTLVYEGNNEHRANGSVTTYTITGLTNGNGYNISVRSVVSSSDGRVTILSYPGDSYSIGIFNTPTITQQDNWNARGESVFIRWRYTPLTSEMPSEFQSSIDNGSTWVSHGGNNPGNATIEGITDEDNDTTVLFRAADTNGIGGPATSFVVRT